MNRSMARVSPYELGNVAAFVYEAAKGLTGRMVESTAEVSQPRPAAGQWFRRGWNDAPSFGPARYQATRRVRERSIAYLPPDDAHPEIVKEFVDLGI
jgi:hypothetical protein